MISAPHVYLDECVDCDLAVRLARRGFVATTTQAQGMVGATDEQQLAFATQNGWAILTRNRRHFQRQHQTYLQQRRPHAGILILPQRGTLDRLELRAVMMLDWIATYSLQHHSALLMWSSLQFLPTRGLQLAGYTSEEIQQALGQLP